VKGTIFEKFDLEYKGINIDYGDLEETFSAKIIEKKKEEDKKTKNFVQIMEPKTSQNLCTKFPIIATNCYQRSSYLNTSICPLKNFAITCEA
jgi:hypothetical protein